MGRPDEAVTGVWKLLNSKNHYVGTQAPEGTGQRAIVTALRFLHRDGHSVNDPGCCRMI